VVILCLPPWRVVKNNYFSRKELEYLDNEDQLREVYNAYVELHRHTSLPVIIYDYTRHDLMKKVNAVFNMCDLTFQHRTAVHSGGNIHASVLLVGDQFGNPKPGDCEYQWPFASLVNSGCSAWLTEQLEIGNISENQLCWVNANELTDKMTDADLLRDKHVIALGNAADLKLTAMGVRHGMVAHPQFHKRFHHGEFYPLLKVIHNYLKMEVTQ
jgi:hypothetical protein